MGDPENYKRAGRAKKAILKYGDWSPGERETTMADLLTDLMHLARLSKLDWYTIHARAKEYYEEEINEDPDSPKDWSPLI